MKTLQKIILGLSLLTQAATAADVRLGGWVTTLREEALQTSIEIEIGAKDQPLDTLVQLMAKPLKGVTIIFPSQKQFPLITGRITGHPIKTIEKILLLNGYLLTERQGMFIVEETPPNLGVKTEVYDLQTPRFDLKKTNEPDLTAFLETTRQMLCIPNQAQNRIVNAKGATIGWEEGGKVPDKRIQYNWDDNNFLLNASPQEQQWFKAVFENYQKPTIPLCFEVDGEKYHTSTKRILHIGVERPFNLKHKEKVWKLYADQQMFVPNFKSVQNEILTGSILEIWVVEDKGTLTLHTKNRDDTITNDTLERETKTEEKTITPESPITLRVGQQAITVKVSVDPTDLTDKASEQQLLELKHSIQQFGQ